MNKKKKFDTNKLINYSAIVILTLASVVLLSIIRDFVIPPDILNLYQITQSNIKLVLVFILFTTYISLVHFPIKNLYDKRILKKIAPKGDKGIRGNRGKQGKNSKCESCGGGDLCYKKILNHITLTYNWWRQLKKLKLYPDTYVIKNEYLISKVKRHCKSDEFKKILNKYGSNNKESCGNNFAVDSESCGSYDYLYRMWSIWTLIILKYENGVLFLESPHLNEIDFINLVTDDIDTSLNSDSDSDFWTDMFNTTSSNDKSIDVKIYLDFGDLNSNFIIPPIISQSGLNKNFFKNTKKLPNNNSPFIEIKNYNAWYWGSDPNSKPKIVFNKQNDDNMKLYKSCVNYDVTNTNPKIKIMITNNYYKIFSTDFSANKKDNNGIITPFSPYGQSYDSKGKINEENKGITFLRAYDYTNYDDHFNFRNYRPIGDVVFFSDEIKNFSFESNKCFPDNLKYKETFNKRIVDGYKYSTILVSGEEGVSVISPKSYKKIYTSLKTEGINENITAFTIWEPVSPTGFISLGYIVTITPYDPSSNPPQPSKNLIWCIHESCKSDNKDKTLKIWDNNNKNLNGDSGDNYIEIFQTSNKYSESDPTLERQTQKTIQSQSKFDYKNDNGISHKTKYNINTFNINNGGIYNIDSESVCEEYNPKIHKYRNSSNEIDCDCSNMDDDEINCNKCERCEYTDMKCKVKSSDQNMKYSILKLYQN